MIFQSAEGELLLSLGRQEPETATRINELLSAGIRWNELIPAAWRQGVAPLLFDNLQRLDLMAQLPERAAHLLRQSYVRAAARYASHAAAIAELLPSFVQAKVDVLLLKGAALAETIYRAPALRPYADIDLLVCPSQIEHAKDALQSCGYRLTPDLISEAFNRHHHANLPFFRENPKPTHIELHWRLSDVFSCIEFANEPLFQRAQSFQLRSVFARTLSQEDTLVYLMSHLDNHGHLNRTLVENPGDEQFALDEMSGNRLIWFTDIHELISAGKIDWNLAVAVIRKAGAEDAAAMTLRLIRRLFDTPIRPEILGMFPLARQHALRRAAGRYILAVARAGEAGQRRRDWILRTLLATRKGFEVRPIRIFDLADYLFRQQAQSRRPLTNLLCASWELVRCLGLFLQLQILRFARIGQRRRRPERSEAKEPRRSLKLS